MLYDFLVVRQITRSNPAHSVRGPKYVVKKGKTPVWSREDAKTLLESIPKDSVSGLRDLALIAAMFYSGVHRYDSNRRLVDFEFQDCAYTGEAGPLSTKCDTSAAARSPSSACATAPP
jgi:site-specific recombinase XerD